ncbi:replication-relaxation family protein [Paenibacillus roseipurpureus]|uniref:Replication-relaxation family protein n=1 Tax=Paenibacillus roseopurpureus TaxID=2918901 RepID=A0AA96RN71_9BACL|nr:replication-relaxation family protein [Paenibacillus sp. MBLB1832]WNR45112.1 replication-relaxation family protein [Paenibacillus sp. MBLB1832]
MAKQYAATILVLVFIIRGLTCNQITRLLLAINSTDGDGVDSGKFRKMMYRALSWLEEQQWVQRDFITVNQKKPYYIVQLTAKGLEEAKDDLAILPGHMGTGFNADFGDFPIELQRPFEKSSSQNVAHHLMTADLFVELVLIRYSQEKQGKPCLDFRDGRYCAREYTWEEKVCRFRPDGELLTVDGKTYFLEVDRGTEDGPSLQNKFNGYHRYFTWLLQQGRELPSGIIFLSSATGKTGFVRRWITCLQAFIEEMKEWYLDINLIVTTTESLKQLLEYMYKC